MIEKWKQVTGYDNYFCSTKGRLYTTKGAGGFVNGYASKDGCVVIALSQDGKIKRTTLARLIASEFIENKNNYRYVCHVDGNQLNNEVSNLYWNNRSSKKIEYKFPCETNEMLTVEEFKDRYNLSVKSVSHILGVNREKMHEYLDGHREFSYKIVERLNKIGIIARGREKIIIPKKKPLTKKEDDIIKWYHLSAIKKFGNTIVSNKFSKEEIIKEFKSLGINVEVRNFSPCSIPNVEIEDTHYVVTQVGRGELHDK